MKQKPDDLAELLRRLNLTCIARHYEDMAREAARDGLAHVEYLRRLAEAEPAARYERGAIVITTNAACKHWPRVFNNDATLTTPILDRLVHHCETVAIEGNIYRMKDKPRSTRERLHRRNKELSRRRPQLRLPGRLMQPSVGAQLK